MATKASKRILWLTQLALLTAITIILQLLSAYVRFGPFQIALALIPIVIGAALHGIGAGAWLGAVFGLVVLLNGDAALFYAFSVPGTIVTVMLKGIAAGAAAGLIYRLLEKKNKTLAAIAAAVTVPMINTGMFVLGCYAFFLPLLREWAGGQNVSAFLFLTVIGGNFLFELATIALLSGVIVRVVGMWKAHRAV